MRELWDLVQSFASAAVGSGGDVVDLVLAGALRLRAGGARARVCAVHLLHVLLLNSRPGSWRVRAQSA
eukprot:1932-Lingulodinium_polyedra.AAC.1